MSAREGILCGAFRDHQVDSCLTVVMAGGQTRDATKPT